MSRLHKLLALGVITTMLFAGLPVFALPVEGCAGTDGPGVTNHVCVSVVDGHRTRVDRAAGVFLSTPSIKQLCGIQFKLFGRVAGKRWERVGKAKCGFNRVWFDFYPKEDFDRGSKLCAAVYEGGRWHGEYGCVNIS